MLAMLSVRRDRRSMQAGRCSRFQRRTPKAFFAAALAAVLSFAVAALSPVGAAAQPPEARSPLEWAKLLLRELSPENTSYRHKKGNVSWKGIDGAAEYQSHTDCSGFVNALLERAYGFRSDDFRKWMGKGRPFAITYHDAIEEERGFRRIDRVDGVRPGDLIAIRYPDGSDNTGHIMVVAGPPQNRQSSEPNIPETEQWQVLVVDSSESGHGKTDTRHKADGTFRSGVGQGLLRLYADPTGRIRGYTWSTYANSQYYARRERDLVVGRLTFGADH